MKVDKRYIQMPHKCFLPLRKFHKIVCCDCGLIHLWELKKQDRVYGYEVTRDNRATAQYRRHHKYKHD